MGKKSKQIHAKNTRAKVRSKVTSKPSVNGNPFEVRQTRKVDSQVVNRRVRGSNRNVAQARSKAFEKRKGTLLVEYNASKKSNAFIDRRWGVNDPTIDEEEKNFIRFKKAKLNKYNKGAARADDGSALGASNEPSSLDLLTHGGRSLEEDDDPDFRHNSDGEEDRDFNRQLTQSNFGSGGDPRNAKTDGKTQKEIMMETILKSKEQKMDRKRDKEQLEKEMEDLDSMFDTLREVKQEEGGLQFKDNKKEERLPKEEYLKKKAAEKEAEGKEAFGDYASLAKQLAFEIRAKATDRTQTPEEIALEERQRLEELENERLKRMGGVTSDSEGDDDDDDELGTGNNGSKLSRRRALKKRRNAKAHKENEAMQGGAAAAVAAGSNKGSSYEDLAAGAAMPFIIDCPSSYDSFLHLLSMDFVQGLEDEMTLVERICKSNSVKLGNGENAGKMEKFMDVLIRWWCQSTVSASGSEGECFDRYHRLSKVLYDLTQQMPKPSGRVCRGALSRMQVAIQQRIMQPPTTARDFWPSFPELAFLQYIPQLFPASDFEHNVVTPAYMVISQCLAQCPIRKARELVSGLFCAGLHFSYAADAGRLVPEGLGFIQSVIIHIAASTKSSDPQHAALMDKIALPHFRDLDLKWIRKKASQYKHTGQMDSDDDTDKTSNPSSTPLLIPFSAFNQDAVSNSDDAYIAASIVSTTLNLIRESVALYAESPAFPELFAHILDALETGNPEAGPALPEPLLSQWSETQAAVQEAYVASRKARIALKLHAQKPVAIRTLEPSYDLSYTLRKDKDEDMDKVRTKQLQREIKREKRGAVRELRKDNEFLAAQKFDEKMDARDEKKGELKRNRAWLDEQVTLMHIQLPDIYAISYCFHS
jgi:nucleolar protein 14